MKDNYIQNSIKTICLRIIIICIFFLAVFASIFFNIPFDKMLSPTNLSYAMSASTAYDSGVDFVEITLNNARYTGIDVYRKNKPYASYYNSMVNNSCTLILVKRPVGGTLPKELNNYTIKAKLVKNDNKVKTLKKELAEELNYSTDGLDKIISPVIIDETSYHADIYFYLILIFMFAMLTPLSLIIVHVIYIIVPEFYPACINFKRLLPKGKKSLSHVNKEINSKVILKSGNITLTENYIITNGTFSIEILPISGVIWAYEHSSWHHILWIPIKLTYTLHFLCRHHVYAFSPRNSKEDIDIVISYFNENYPEIITGYSKKKKEKAFSILKEHKKKKLL